MEERVDLLVPYGCVDISIQTFHAFGDRLLREHALHIGLSPQFRVLSRAEQLVLLRRRVFRLGLEAFRPLVEPTRFVEGLATVFGRAKDEAVGPEEFLAHARELTAPAASAPDDPVSAYAKRMLEVATSYLAYERLLRELDAVDFGDQVLLAVRLLEQHPEVLAEIRARYRHILVDEFQDTNYAQFQLLRLLAHPQANITVVADDDQSIYKWRGAALSNVLKFLDHYESVRTVVLTENFRSSQPILDAAYRLIRFNDPDRLEVRQGIDKRLVARASQADQAPHFHVFDTASGEADWVARTIRGMIESGSRLLGDIAILVRSNREADLFLRALNVAGVPWQFSGASGLFARAESKLLLSCLKALADPEDAMSWYHVASSPLYRCSMPDLMRVMSAVSRTHRSVHAVLEELTRTAEAAEGLSLAGREELLRVRRDIDQLLELSRTHSAGQLMYRWLADRNYFAILGHADRMEETSSLQTVARFFHQLRRVEELVGGSLPELIQHLELFQAMGNEAPEDDDAWADRVQVMTIHKAKGLEFPAVFLVGLVHGRFPTARRRDPIDLPERLVKDILPQGDYHLQEERRLFYVGMTRARDELHLTCAYDYGGKSVRKISQFVLEALDLSSPTPPAKAASARELIERSQKLEPLPLTERTGKQTVLRLDPHGADDYLTCPLKYRYSHVLRIPVMRHHLVVYGAALHKAVEAFFKRRMQGQTMEEAELLTIFESQWRSEGFLTREHEALRLAQGRETLHRFYRRQQESPEHPTLIEEKFAFPLDDLLIVGRWDRVDCRGEEAVIIDYKSSDVSDPRDANRRAKDSLQLLVYALAWRTLHGQLPARVELRFLESGVVGAAQFTEPDLEQARAALRKVAAGIRAQSFTAQPQEYACQWCAFQSICPSAFRSR